MKVFTFCLILGQLFLSCVSYGQEIENLRAQEPDATGTVTAIVREVRQGTFPDVLLTLWSMEQGEWEAMPKYKRPGGSGFEFYYARENVRDFAAYYLLPGDFVTVNRIGVLHGPMDVVWEVNNIKRLPGGASPQLPNGGGHLQSAIATDRGSYAKAQRIRFAFTVRNVSRETVALRFPSGQRYEFVVYRNEHPVWHWSKDRAFTMALQTRKLEPGEELVFSEDWNQTLDSGRQAEPGIYKVVAELKTSGGQKAEATAVFEIE